MSTSVQEVPETRPPGGWPADRLLAHWRIWTVAAVIGAVLGGVLSFAIAKSYQASSLVMVTEIQTGEAAARPRTTIRVLAESRALADRVFARFRDQLTPYGVTVERFLAAHLRAEEVRGTNLLRLTVRLPDPRLAHDVCQFLTTSLIEYYETLQEGSATVMLQGLKEQLAAVDQKVRGAEERLDGLRGTTRSELNRREPPARLGQQSEIVDLLVEIEAQRTRIAEEYERAERLLIAQRAVLQVADPASLPERAIWPNPFLFAATGALLGLLASGLAVVVGVFSRR